MEPRTQYAQTKDGVNIAFWTLATASHKPLGTICARGVRSAYWTRGDGKPLVSMPAGLADHSSRGGK